MPLQSWIRFPKLATFLLLTGGIAPASDWFQDVSQSTGLDFVHFNGMTGQFSIAEVIGSGAALFDYDNDGDLDVFLVQGASLNIGEAGKEPLFPLPRSQPENDRLFRNDLTVSANGKREVRFVDVTEESGIESNGYGMGVAVADVDGNGFLDLYVTNFGPDQLWLNLGKGKFQNASSRGDAFPNGWGTSAAFFDYDKDGDQDLFVAQYLDYKAANHKTCRTSTGEIDYCGPKTYEPIPDRLYQNQGDGSFRDVTTKMGIHRAFGAGLGIVAADFNNDGWVDVFVANDGAANQLWINQKGRGFEDEGLIAGCGLNADGNPEASMGIAVADFDDDGDQDLFLTHLRKETNTLYVNDGKGWFEDRTIAAGLAAPSTAYTAFGTGWLDVDNDGILDLIALNGTVQIIDELAASGDAYPLHQPNQLFRGLGEGRFEEANGLGGEAFKLSEVSRGAAFGDIDNDGDLDVLVTNNNGKARLLENLAGQNSQWLGVVPQADQGKAVAGAAVALKLKGGKIRHGWSRRDGSFLCANDPRLLFGLASKDQPVEVVITWPDGGRESWPVSKTKTYLMLKRGTGTKTGPPAKP